MGDIILIEKGETAPADVILLDSSEVINREAICYIESNLVDG